MLSNYLRQQQPEQPLLTCIEQLQSLQILSSADAAQLKKALNNEEDFFKTISILLSKALGCVNKIHDSTRTDEQIKLLSRAILATNALLFISIAQTRSNQLLLKQLNREVQIK